MRKHFSILAITLMALVVVFGSCKKDKPTPSDNKEYTLTYQVNNQAKFVSDPMSGEYVTINISPCFKFDLTYVDANGNTIEESNVTLPWEKTLTVKRPFTAKLTGNAVYNESELPDTVYYGTPYSISITGNGTILSDKDENIARTTKERFLEHIAGSNRLKFEGKVSLN